MRKLPSGGFFCYRYDTNYRVTLHLNHDIVNGIFNSAHSFSSFVFVYSLISFCFGFFNGKGSFRDYLLCKVKHSVSKKFSIPTGSNFSTKTLQS